MGNALAAVSGGKNIQYSYDHAGHRIRKVVDGAVTQMCYAGDLLVSERTGSEKTLWYRYDSSGNVIALTYESEIYMYLRNAQNDIIGLLDKDGKVVVRYTYDSWRQVVKIEGTLKDKVGALITGVWGTTFGLSGNLTAAGVSAGISMSNMSENKTINQPISASHISVSIPKNAIGQSRTFNGKNKVYSTSFIYKASNGKVVYKKRKNYYPRNARTV